MYYRTANLLLKVWSPWLAKDKEVLEKVQQRAINMVSGLSYEEIKEAEYDNPR